MQHQTTLLHTKIKDERTMSLAAENELIPFDDVTSSPSSKKTLYKYTILSILCLIQFSKAYCENLTVGLQHTIIQVMKIDNTLYGVLHSAVTYPGTILPLVGGLLSDKFVGVGKLYCLPFLVGTALLGQILLTVGASVDTFWVMIIGRSFLGIADGLQVNLLFSCKTIWFKDDLTIALAVGFACTSFGATTVIVLSQIIYDSLEITNRNFRLGLVISVGCILMIVALFSSIILVVIDEKGEKKELVVKPQKKTKINFNDFKDFSLAYWSLFLSLSLYYGATDSFVANGQVLFISKYGLSITEASIANTIIYFGVVLINPFIGLLINTSQYHILWCIAGIMLSIGSNLLVLCTSLMKPIPFIVGCINAVSFSLFITAIWPIVPRIVQHHQLNTAYGIINCTWVSPLLFLLTGAIIDYIGYTFQVTFYIALHAIGIVFLLILLVKAKDIHRSNTSTVEKEGISEN